MASSGLLLVDKPSGLTSHDVVARVRRIYRERRVGHAGTLDPMATGLLVLGVGPSTRLLRFAQSETKRYRGTLRLGVATDSLDADGVETERRPVPEVSAAEMDAAAAGLLGRQQQVPPMVSAVKVGGQRLHRLARQGVEVERPARAIVVAELAMHPCEDTSLWDFEVECSTGTYVRVLMSDLAERLGTVGHLAALRRLASGRHHVDDAVSLDELERMVGEGRSPLRSPLEFVGALARVVLDADDERRMRQGQRVLAGSAPDADEIAALDASGALIGVLGRRSGSWQPELVLPVDPQVPG
jgi:tRNA pseudouridine55 synthase